MCFLQYCHIPILIFIIILNLSSSAVMLKLKQVTQMEKLNLRIHVLKVQEKNLLQQLQQNKEKEKMYHEAKNEIVRAYSEILRKLPSVTRVDCKLDQN